VGESTESAVARIVAARAGLADEIDRLEASGRAAVDIPAKIRRSPAKAAAIAKARGFIEALRYCAQTHDRISQRQIRS
jgi:hypothetical protein